MMASGLNTWHILIIWYICNFLRQTDRKIYFFWRQLNLNRAKMDILFISGESIQITND